MGRHTSCGQCLAVVLPWCCHLYSILAVHCHPCSTLPGLQHWRAQHDRTQEPWYVGEKHSEPPWSRGDALHGRNQGFLAPAPHIKVNEAFGYYRWVREVSLSKQPVPTSGPTDSRTPCAGVRLHCQFVSQESAGADARSAHAFRLAGIRSVHRLLLCSPLLGPMNTSPFSYGERAGNISSKAIF